MKEHSWILHDVRIEDIRVPGAICVECGIEVFYPDDFGREDWEPSGISKDCDLEKVRQVMES